MSREEIKEQIEAIQERINAIGFKGNNEYDLHLRHELAVWVSEFAEQQSVLFLEWYVHQDSKVFKESDTMSDAYQLFLTQQNKEG